MRGGAEPLIVAPAAPASEAVGRFRADLEALAGAGPARFGVAASGGPDSLALMLLAHAAAPGRVAVATVDHGLRAGSGAEAEWVGEICRQLGLPHQVLRPAAPIGGSLQAEARRVRYALLEDWRATQALDWILTAHHADDQVETLLMRLNRGTGVAGLSGVRAVNRRVLRPLLGWRRAELATLVRDAGLTAVADPSNVDDRFDRARLRARLTGADWIEPSGFARSAQALAEADAALDWAVVRLLAERCVEVAGEVRLDPSDLPAELRRRLVLAVLRRLEPSAEPRGDELARLIATLAAGGTATLAGVKARGGDSWSFALAPPRRRA